MSLNVKFVQDYNEFMKKVWMNAIIEASLFYPAALLHCPISYLIRKKEARELVEFIINEGEKVARILQYDIHNIFRDILEMGISAKDYFSPVNNLWEVGIKSEVDFFNGYIYEIGKQFNVNAAFNAAIWYLIKIHESTMGFRYHRGS